VTPHDGSRWERHSPLIGAQKLLGRDRWADCRSSANRHL